MEGPTPERKTPERRSRQARRTRDTLAQAAFELVLDRGLRYVTVEEIAEAADVDRRTFSRYFASKEAAALDSLRGDGDRINEALRSRPAEEPPILAYRRAVLAWLADPDAEPWHRRPRIFDLSVVNMSSILGTNGFASSPAYVAAEHGVVGLTKTAALEYAAQNVRINAAGPGFIDTPLLRNADPQAREHLISLHPAGRLGTAEEVVELTVFLLSDKASFIHGSYHLVDGGYSAP
ncbi:MULTISPECIES: SDR family oxidoreductase [unclassified Streptomyces]|uniref:SDR family oxidoreductase n=1 Tax=unclassified Streptomyces TaxID=2593676 RepID=UPI00203597C9|nr:MULTISPECIES: SDR family oxidoreductase [unclassified Streptomyces]